MKKIFLVLGLLFLISPQIANAQSQRNPCYYNTSTSTGCISVSGTNPLPVLATATIGGGFTDTATGTPISVTTGGVTGTLPAGTVVAAFNVGTTNGAYCKLGASSSTSDIYLAPNGGWFAFSVGVSTQLTCITSTSTTTVNMVGGSGLPTGSGGGAGGSGGGAVTIADGADVTEGAIADASSSVGGAGSLSAKLRRITTQLDTIQTAVQAAIPAQSDTVPIGGVGICDGANGATNPCTTAQTVLAASTASAAANKPAVVALHPSSGTPASLSPYPFGATPYTATATGTTGATTATLAGASSVTTYLCGFSIRANATAAATNNATVTGVITATLNFTQWTAPLASGIGVTEEIFSPCIPASGTNQSIAVISGAPGSGGVVSVTAWGYKL